MSVPQPGPVKKKCLLIQRKFESVDIDIAVHCSGFGIANPSPKAVKLINCA